MPEIKMMTWNAWSGIFLLSMKRNHDVDPEDLSQHEWHEIERMYREGEAPAAAVELLQAELC